MVRFSLLFCVILSAISCAEGEVSMNGGASTVDLKSADELVPAGSAEADARGQTRGSTDQEANLPTDDIASDDPAIGQVANIDADMLSESTMEVEVEVGSGEQPQINEFICLSESKILKAGETQVFSWQLPTMSETITVQVYSDDIGISLGSLSGSGNQFSFTAPALIPETISLQLRAQIESTGEVADCSLTLQKAADIGVEDDGKLDGLVGKVIQLATNTSLLPNFDDYESIADIAVANLDIPKRSFDTGFPGVPDLFEWFGIQFVGQITVASDGYYDFKVSSDDGSKLYIGGELIIDNDGTHAVKAKSGQVYLTAGDHPIVVEYFQGPRYHIALQLFWKQASESDYSIVSAEVLSRPQP